MKTEEKIILIGDNRDLKDVNDLLKNGWKVKMTSCAAASLGSMHTAFTGLVVLYREII